LYMTHFGWFSKRQELGWTCTTCEELDWLFKSR
jgi:hypothetical protein